MPSIDDTTLAALVALAILAVIVIAVVLVRRSGRNRLERLGPAFELGTVRPAGPLGTGVEGGYRGFQCRYTVEHASQYSPGGANLRAHALSVHRWSAGLSDFGARLMVQVGILKDLEIGDQELDSRLRFSGADPGAVAAVFGQQSARQAMRVLADTDNFQSVSVRDDRVDVKWVPRRAELDEDPEVLRVRLEALVGLLVACGSTPRLG
jgi:hypothetical protein